MEPVVVWQHKWSQDLFIPGYLFFGGLTAGLVVVAAAADLLSLVARRFGGLARVAALTAVPVLAVAGVLLTIHLGKPERGLGFPLFFTNYNSWMTRGGWVVGAVSPLIVAYGALWFFRVFPGLRRLVALLLVGLAPLLAMYTGFLLSGAGYVPLWSGEFLPLVFLNSGLTTGVAAAGLVLLLAALVRGGRGEDPTWSRRWVAAALVLLIGLELYELREFVTHLATRAPDKALLAAAATVSDPADPGGEAPVPTGQFVAPIGSRLAYQYLTGGPEYPRRLLEDPRGGLTAGGRTRPTLAAWFWIGVIGVGLLAPLALTVVELGADMASRRAAHVVAGLKFACVLAGGFLLRLVIVWGGDLKAPLPFPPQLFQLPGFGG